MQIQIDDDVVARMVRRQLLGADTAENFRFPATPRIGSVWQNKMVGGTDGIYVGIARGHAGDQSCPLPGTDYPLILGEESPKKLKWQAALAWAAKVGNGWRVPTRREQALCWANVPELFQQEWYWSCQQYEGYADCAWAQFFGYGSQLNYHKDTECRVRLLRSVIVID